MRSAETFGHNIERAYVKISTEPPGLRDQTSGFLVKFTVKNYGRTPASVTDLYMKWLVLGSDEAPPTNIGWSEKDRRGLATFLVAKDHVQFWERRKPAQWPEIKSERLRLWLFAYVDYRDIFGKPIPWRLFPSLQTPQR